MKKLRTRFILITMLSLTIVLFLLLGTISLVNYHNVNQSADDILLVLANNDGSFNIDNPRLDDGSNIIDNNGQQNRNEDFEREETPYETRYFTITFINNEVASVNLNYIASINKNTAITMAESVLNKSKKGYVGVYRYLISYRNDKTQVIFLDNTKNLQSVQNFLVTGIYVSLIGELMVFILVYLLSRRVFSPVEKSYTKQKRFITNASHELKTPLTIISANNELLEMEHGESESSKAISKQVSRMTTMVKNMTLLSKLDESEAIDGMHEVNLSSLLEEVSNDYINVFKASNKAFNANIDPSITIKGDESLLSKMISLLLDNANKYALTKVNISLSLVGKHVELITSNDANIIEKDGNVFLERFYRAANARNSVEGSGIGLSLVEEIVLHHHGTIHIETTSNSYECKIEFKI